MFIKVHDPDGKEMYINTELVECVDQDGSDEQTRLYVNGDSDSFYKCQEPIDDIMKIIGYFKVGSDK